MTDEYCFEIRLSESPSIQNLYKKIPDFTGIYDYNSFIKHYIHTSNSKYFIKEFKLENQNQENSDYYTLCLDEYNYQTSTGEKWDLQNSKVLAICEKSSTPTHIIYDDNFLVSGKMIYTNLGLQHIMNNIKSSHKNKFSNIINNSINYNTLFTIIQNSSHIECNIYKYTIRGRFRLLFS